MRTDDTMKKKIFLLSSLFIVFDQIIKVIIRNTLTYHVEYFIIPKFFYLTYVKNTGGAFSMLENNQLFLALIGCFFIAFIVSYIYKKKDIKKIDVITYSLLISGIIGNLIDRILLNGVTDYIGLIFGNYYYPIFNFADICIVIGVIILVLIEFRGEKNGSSSN